MAMGHLAVRCLLFGRLDLGDESICLPAEPALTDHIADARRRSPLLMGRLWAAVGTCRTDEYRRSRLASLLRQLARLPIAPSRQALPGAGGIKCGDLLDHVDPVAGAELRRVWPHGLHPRQLR